MQANPVKLSVLPVLFCALLASVCKPAGDSGPGGPEEWLYVTAASGLRLRAEPNTQSTRLGLVPVNERVLVLERSPQKTSIDGVAAPWIKVRYGDVSGWVFGGYLAAVKKTEDPDRARDLYVGLWSGRNTCEGRRTEVEVKADNTWRGWFFGGCDVSGCFCGSVEGEWKAEAGRICFSSAGSDFQATPEGRDACYRRSGGQLVASGVSFVENFGSESLTALSKSDAQR